MVKEEKMKRLVRSAIRGNVDAYGQLIEEYKTYLYRTAWLYVRNEDLALDVVQESILKGFRQIKTLKEARYFKTWLTRILINTAKDMLSPVSYTHLCFVRPHRRYCLAHRR